MATEKKTTKKATSTKKAEKAKEAEEAPKHIGLVQNDSCHPWSS